MQDYYNMNQTTLSIALDYLPEENHPARYINQLVESLKLTYTYQFGRPREYDLGALLKLVLLAYSYGFLAVVRLKDSRVKINQPDGWSATKFLRIEPFVVLEFPMNLRN
ncbi:Mobile element protein [Levilactobacillus brevis]|nr:Mobile element protein [Levilactobacillus brevis]